MEIYSLFAITCSKPRTLTRTLLLINKELNQFQFCLENNKFIVLKSYYGASGAL